MSRTTARTRPEPQEPHPFSEAELRAWRGFLRLHRRVTEELSRRLDRHHGLTLAHYGVLITLVTVPGRRMWMSDLAERVLVSPSGMTRAVAWLADGGLVRRDRDPDDGRSFVVELTPDGLARLREAQVTHHACVRELLFDGIEGDDLERLAAFYERSV
ncbi:MAG TPA: MarR family winged helix-turn-helix transcriptional regulator [Gaiellales bacterium]|nr:MarR family winged helix-turn-helix transcriptional regulator [Gaiellales bacterium]